MKANAADLLTVLKNSPQFVIPIYQRTYSWAEKECRQLWDDVLRAGKDDAVKVHFIGSIVYIEHGTSTVSHMSPIVVIDGQQRLTTVTLFLAALAESLEDAPPTAEFTARKLRNYYLINPEESGERRYKLLLSQTDKVSLIAVVSGAEQPKEPSRRVTGNFELFKGWLAGFGGDLAVICKGLAKLMVVDVALTQGQDDPQLIFESMNSTGRELSQADLIRNSVLMGLEPKLQAKLYEQFWRPMELDFGQEAYGTHFDGFMRHFLTMRTGEIPNMNAVYEAFKAYARSPAVSQGGTEAMVREVRDHARYYCAMALQAEPDAGLNAAFRELVELRVDVAYPLLLELYRDYDHQVLPRDDFVEAVRAIESYVFRRAICAIPTNSMNRTFANLTKNLNKDRYLESLLARLLDLKSYRRFPSDDEFRRDLQTRDLYKFYRRSYWLLRLENHERKELVMPGDYTIEHILPQNENLSPAWKAALGADWKRVHETLLHTLGNLTLTGYNSENRDHPFPQKRDAEKVGFKFSPLKLNAGLGIIDVWNEDAIRARAGRLAEWALRVWVRPDSTPGAQAVLGSKPKVGVSYTLDDHPQLQPGAVRDLFEAFRQEVIALDPRVTEEILKLYVAYKAETNFVDVVPQAKRLRLSLNMPFSEVQDPKGLCKDVSNVGRWGNGDVEVRFSSLDELPDVMALVRQSFDRQVASADAPPRAGCRWPPT